MESLKRLKQTGSVRDYVTDFSSLMLFLLDFSYLMLGIRNMSEEDKFFNFISCFHGWTQIELPRQEVLDLPIAMAAANCLMDYKMGDTIQKTKSNGGKKSKIEEKFDCYFRV